MIRHLSSVVHKLLLYVAIAVIPFAGNGAQADGPIFSDQLAAGNAAFLKGDMRAAEHYFASALDSVNDSNSDPNMNRAIGLFWHGMALARLASHEAAKKDFEKALGIFESVPDIAESSIMLAHGELASINATLENLQEAEVGFRRALKLAEKRSAANEAQFLTTVVGDLGSLLASAKRYDEAEPLLRRLLLLRESFGPQYVEVQRYAAFQLAFVLSKNDKQAEAIDILRKAATLAGHSSQPPEESLASVIGLLGQLLVQPLQREESLTLLRQSLAMREALYGEKSPKLALTLSTIADRLEAQGNFPEAEPTHRRLVTIFELDPVRDARALALAKIGLGRNLWKQLRSADAEIVLNEAYSTAINGSRSDPKLAVTVLLNLVSLRTSMGQAMEANAILRKIVDLEEKSGATRSIKFAEYLEVLARSDASLGNTAEAKLLYERSLAILETTAGRDPAKYSQAIVRYASFLPDFIGSDKVDALYAEAFSRLERARPMDVLLIGETVREWAGSLFSRRKYSQAQDILRRAIALVSDESRGRSLELSRLYLYVGDAENYQGKDAGAEKAYSKAIEVAKQNLPLGTPEVVNAVEALGHLQFKVGDFQQAEKTLLSALALADQSTYWHDPLYQNVLHTLGLVWINQGRYAEAEKMLLAHYRVQKNQNGSNSLANVPAMSSLGELWLAMGRTAEAEAIFRDSAAILGKSGEVQQSVLASNLCQLTLALSGQDKNAEAEPVAKRCLELRYQLFGKFHPLVYESMISYGHVLKQLGRYQEALKLQTDALEIGEGLVTKLLQHQINNLSELALLYLQLDRGKEALSTLDRAVALKLRADPLEMQSDARRSRAWTDHLYGLHARLLIGQNSEIGDPNSVAIARAFESVQRARANSSTELLAEAAARRVSNNVKLEQVIRGKRALGVRREKLLKTYSESMSLPQAQRANATEESIRRELESLDSSAAAFNRQLHAEFPAYEELTNPEPVSVADVQMLLRADEALVTWLIDQRELLTVVVTRKNVVMHLSVISQDEVTALVRTLRIATEIPAAGDLLPFPTDRARDLYGLLFGPVEKDLADIKHLILVPDGPLQSLSFGLLQAGAAGTVQDPRKIPWLARKYSLTTLPAVSSLRALRTLARPQIKREPFIGFGDPTLSGDGAELRGANIAKLFARGKVADPRAVSQLQPLPETADELRSIARVLKANENNIYLRDAATETQVKRLPLSRYEVVAFATHGLLAGEFNGIQEPALVLTPPATGTDEDDGLLTASEVAGLELDADSVVLSACNTAAPDGTPGAQGFTGLSKAFFYAGARTLLVSHWAVESKSAMKLTTQLFAEQKKGASKAQALQRAMMTLADRPETAHPALWAPFVVVGEGNTK